ncbi:MAG: phosphohydrolase, partial [Merdibacter sp.]|nr:phosphohydrolase [Merdibacter sp.]
GYRHSNDLLNQLVSGQLDADRMDYLLRDAYFTGTSYGAFDMERILRTIRICGSHVAVKASGIHSVEDYIMARYHMYWQVYLHPVARSYEIIVSMLFSRMKEIWQKDPSFFHDLSMFVPFLSDDEVSIQKLHQMDESAVLYGCSLLLGKKDRILRDLSQRILDRKLFEYVEYSAERLTDIKERTRQYGYDPRYYVYLDHVMQRPYSPYKGRKDSHVIWIVDEDGKLSELSEKSAIVHALIHADVKEQQLIYYPLEIGYEKE